jgi:hypothetical protein
MPRARRVGISPLSYDVGGGLASGLTHDDIPTPARSAAARFEGPRAISAALDAGELEATNPRLQVIERIDNYHEIVARLDHATATPTASRPLALGVKPAENEPARTGSALSTY